MGDPDVTECTHSDVRAGRTDLMWFAGLTVVWSVVLYGIWGFSAMGYSGSMAWLAEVIRGPSSNPMRLALHSNWVYSVPALALILAARGFPWPRKALYAGALVGSLVAVDVMVIVSGLLDAMRPGFDPDASALMQSTKVLVFHTLRLGIPLTVLALFAGLEPQRLWGRA